MRIYDDLFSSLNQPIAQVLLTRSDLVQRSRYVNSYRTFRQLLRLGVIPVVNENDTVAVEELKFGDNDTLSSLVASLIGADWLFLLTDVDKLYSADPRYNPDAKPIHLIEKLEEITALKSVAGNRGTQWGTGGMATKLEAAQIATTAGIRTVITDGKKPENILRAITGEPIGTQFAAHPTPNRGRKRWLATSLVPAGRIYIDTGAAHALTHAGKSLLAAGITEIEGDFDPKDAVIIYTAEGKEIARGIVNYGDKDLRKILGRHSDEIPNVLGYSGADTVVHRDNLVLANQYGETPMP
jgi:glutamate 5-kinase